MAQEAALKVMARLATPLWLMRDDGRVVWCNGAARHHLGIADGHDGIVLRATLGRARPAPGPDETGIDSTLGFSVGGRERSVRCRLSRAGEMNGFGGDCLLAEAARADAEAAAESEAVHQLTTLVHHLSHELRTPLNAVVGFSEIIADDLMPSNGAQRYRDYAGEIRSAAAYMLDLINNLLDLARIRAGGLDLREELCDLERLIGTTVHMMALYSLPTHGHVSRDYQD